MVCVDQSLCIGCGICTDMCPEVFNTTDDGKVQAVAQQCELHNLEEIADACPVDAIDI